MIPSTYSTNVRGTLSLGSGCGTSSVETQTASKRK